MAKKQVTGEDGKVYTVKEKKPFYKRVWFWIVAIIALFIIGGALGGGDDDKNGGTKVETTDKEDTPSDENTSEDTTSKDEEAKKEEAFGLNQDVTVGDVIYNVSSVESAKEVGPSIAPTKATDTFVVITLTVTNKGNEAITVDSSFFKLIDGDKTFDADAAASMSANQNDSGEIANSFFLQNLNPDVSLSGKVVFDVSEAQSTSESNQLQVQTGVFGTEKELINLK